MAHFVGYTTHINVAFSSEVIKSLPKHNLNRFCIQNTAPFYMRPIYEVSADSAVSSVKFSKFREQSLQGGGQDCPATLGGGGRPCLLLNGEGGLID